MQDPPDRREPGLERLDRELLEGVIEIEPRRQGREGHESDQGERELQRNPAPDGAEQEMHQASGSSR